MDKKLSKNGITYKSTNDEPITYLPYKNGYIIQTIIPTRVFNGCVTTIREK